MTVVGWSGQAPARVTPAEILAAIRGLADELGLVVACACGARRFCPAPRAQEDAAQFFQLHAAHRAGRFVPRSKG